LDKAFFDDSLLRLSVCTFGSGVAGKDTMWYQEEKSTLETTDVSDASSHSMSG
jgi:hypothetical protein